MPTMRLTILPRVALLDAPLVKLVAEELKSRQPVTISCEIMNTKDRFGSFGHYVASTTGKVDCCNTASIAGTFTGIQPMGHFWSIRAMPGQREGLRFAPMDASIPISYKFSLFNGHCENPWDKHLKAEAVETHERLLMAPNVTRIPVREGRIRGALFVPKRSNDRANIRSDRFPCLIDLYGTRGGLVEYRAALLASRGFLVLALAYFAFEDLPASFTQLDLEYFEEAVEWLSAYSVDGSVGVIGTSLGGDIAVNMAIACSNVKACVAINCFNALDGIFSLRKNGKQLAEAADYRTDDFEFIGTRIRLHDGKLNANHSEEKDYKVQIFGTHQVERSNAHFLFVCGEADESNPSVWAATRLCKRLQRADKADRAQLLSFQRTGHLIEPPFSPVCTESFHKHVGCILLWGGIGEDHANAQVAAWQRIIAHLKQHLVV